MPNQKTQTLPLGTVLNSKWVILEFITKGGMGEIYRAHQLNLKRDVAIKIISKEWLDDIAEDEEERDSALKRFRQEVHTMAQIRHPNVIQIYDFDTARIIKNGETFELEYIALEYIPGRTLRDTMREEGCYHDEKEAISWLRRYFLPVIDGVEAIHKAGIFHRDLKPENVLLDGDIPKIADFGLARSCRLESMTCSMEIKGTPPYMAPEQFVDFKGTDQRADIYALGKILYEAVAGKMAENTIPFTRARLKEVDTPFFKRIDEIIRKATDEKSENRYQSVKELKAAIEEGLVLVENRESRRDESATQERHAISLSGKKAALLGIGTAILLVALSFWGYHSIQEHIFQTPVAKVRKIEIPSDIPAQIAAQDGSVLKFVPGGPFMVPAGFDQEGPRTVTVQSFYMDETPITNQQFVNFLNQTRSNLTIEEDAVKQGQKIYLYLGQVMQGYEPIIYDRGVFKVTNSSHSSCPVLRVTAFGAHAYASFYNERLPRPVEWLYVASEGQMELSANGSARIIMPEGFFKPLKLPHPVMMLNANLFGIKGMNINLGSWVRDPLPKGAEGTRDGFAILGGFDKAVVSSDLIPRPVKRNPWEAFEEVGFRCVKDINGNGTRH